MAEQRNATSVKELVLQLIADGITDNQKLADMCRKAFPGASTTAASVSSIKSNARKSGELEAAVLTQIAEDFQEDDPIPEDGEEGVTDEEILERIKERFDALDRMADAVMRGKLPALICSGPPGLGKSFGIKRAIDVRKLTYEQEWLEAPKTLSSKGFGVCSVCRNPVEEDEHGKFCSICDQYVMAEQGVGVDSEFKFDYISGSISGPGLYIALWNLREGGLVVLDDCDAVFQDEDTLNILKAVLDSCDRRVISWRKQSRWLKEMDIDPQFEFKGSVIFLTNIDFERKIESSKPGAVHFKALMDRCLYLHLTIRSMRDFMIRIQQVVYDEKMLDKYGMSEVAIKEIMAFVDDNKRRFNGLSLRLIHQIATLRISDETNWRKDVEMTKMRAFTEELAESAKTKLLEADNTGAKEVSA